MTKIAPAIKHKTVKESMAATYGESSESKKNIEFGAPEVRVYKQTVGDNPSVSRGPPLQLDWKWKQQDEVEEKETEWLTNGQKSTANVYPKPVSRIPLTRRQEILRANGIKDQEALRFQKIATVTRNNRSKTIRNLSRAELEERMEEIRDLLQCKKNDMELIQQCQSIRENAPVDVSLESPCLNCCQHALKDADKAFYKMYKCDGSCMETK